MPDGVFITGATGFVGRRLLAAAAALGRPVFALVRSPGPEVATSGVSVVLGDLLRPESYRHVLPSCDTALHLAATTGRATAADHERVNVTGTQWLLEECVRAGVRNVLFVSSVATTFPDKTGYHYALAKARAEDAVRRSRLRFLILRPTMIFGPGAPVLAGLEKLATLPVAVLPGDGRARVQPIHVDDVVSCLLSAVRLDAFEGDALTIGGRDTVSIEDLMRRIRAARLGTRGPLVRVPLPLLQLPLSVAEAIGLGRVLPLTAGQLTSFRFNGVGSANRLLRSADLVGIDQMLVTSSGSAPRESGLDAECAVFTRHLVGRAPSQYVCLKYRAAHLALSALSPVSRFDAFLVRFARIGPLCTKAADAHAAVFTPGSLLRKKLVVLLAILETCSPYCDLIDAPLGSGRVARAVAAIGLAGLGALVALLVALPVLLPIQLALALVPKAAR